MQLDIVQLDLNKTRENWPAGVPFTPAYVKKFKRNESANWLALEQPLAPGQPPAWAKTVNDEYMRIPLFPYTLNAQADLALAFMLQLGLSCAGYLPAAVERFFVVTGTPVELLYNPDTDVNTGIRYFVGFAVILK
jgi:hypothetical protein